MTREHTAGRPAIVITGASSGIGYALARELSQAFTVFAGIRHGGDAGLVSGPQGSIVPLALDVTDAASIARATEAVALVVGAQGLAGLINNAGICITGPIESVPIDAWRAQFAVNLFGPVAVTQAFLPLLRQGRGRIVNIGSIAGRHALPATCPYAASKHALAAVTDALRMEVQPFGMAVSLVEPGAIETPIWDKRDVVSRPIDGYTEMVERIEAAAEASRKQALPPDAVVRCVRHALTSRYPRPRYLVGRDARLRAVLRLLLPDRVHDRLLAAVLHLPRSRQVGDQVRK